MAILLSAAIASDVKLEIIIEEEEEEGHDLATQARDDNRTIPSRHFYSINAKHGPLLQE